MPPGNSNNKGSVPVVCSYCGKKDCSGESRHIISFQTSTARVGDHFSRTSLLVRRPIIDPVQTSVNQRSAQGPSGVNFSTNTTRELTTQKSAANHQEVKSRDVASIVESKQDNLKDDSKQETEICNKSSSDQNIVPLGQLTQNSADAANVTSTVVNDSNFLSDSRNVDVFQTGEKNGNTVDSNSVKDGKSESYIYEEKNSADISKENPINEKHASNSLQTDAKNETSEFPTSIASDMNQSLPKDNGNLQNRIVEPRLLDGTYKSSSSETCVKKLTTKKHSPNATIHDGVVLKILDSRTAMLQVGNADTEPRFAELFVDNLLPSRNEPPFKINTNIKSVLSVGDRLTLICTNHVKKTSMYQLFAHEAWKTENARWNDNKSNNFDKESVISFTSQSSAPLSEQQEKRTKRMRRKRLSKEKLIESNSDDVSDAVNQWLDQNERSRLNKNGTLIEGYEYNGLVTDLRLPYVFVIEVLLKEGTESIFAKAIDFHPEGPHSISLPYNVSLQGLLNIGDKVCVIPKRDTKVGWQAKKVWLKERKLEPYQFAINGIHNQEINALGKNVNLTELQEEAAVSNGSGTDVDGVILSLQTTWGLVKHVEKMSTYVFHRKNTYLYGVCLKNYVLDDVLREGQTVKFSLEDGEYGLINAKKLWLGETYSSFYSWQRGLRDYCDTFGILNNIENSLVKLGENLFTYN